MALINDEAPARRLAQALCADLTRRLHADPAAGAIVMQARELYRERVRSDLHGLLDEELTRFGLPGAAELAAPQSNASKKYRILAIAASVLLLCVAAVLWFRTTR